MERLLGSDPDELRAQHLFDFAQVCHIPPPMVDALRYLDFIRLILHIEKLHADAEKTRRERANGG